MNSEELATSFRKTKQEKRLFMEESLDEFTGFFDAYVDFRFTLLAQEDELTDERRADMIRYSSLVTRQIKALVEADGPEYVASRLHEMIRDKLGSY